MSPDGRRGGEELEGVEEGKTMIKTYGVGEKRFTLKENNKKK